MTYIMSEYEYGVACIAHGEEDATVMFLLKAGFVGFDDDDLLLKQQPGSYTPAIGATGGNTYVRMGRQGEEKPGQMPGVFTTPDGVSVQPTRGPTQFAVPGFGHDAQVRRFARQQGMKPTIAPASGKESGAPSAYYDFGEGAPKIPASLMERAKAKIGRGFERGKTFLEDRGDSRMLEGVISRFGRQPPFKPAPSAERRERFIEGAIQGIPGVDGVEIGKPKKDAETAPAAPEEATPPAAPTPAVPTDVAPETAPKPETAPEPEPAAKPKTAPTADPEAGKEIRAKKDAKTVKVAPKSTEVAEQDPVDDELQRQQDELNEQLAQIRIRQEGGATTPSMPEPKAPPATMTAPEDVERTPFQTLASKLAGAYPSAKRSEEFPYGQSASRILDRLQMGEKPFGEGYDPELGPLSISKPLTATQMDKLRALEGIEELYPQIRGLEDILNPKQPVGGGPPANMEFVDPDADPMQQQFNLSYDSPMDLAWDALLFRKTHQ